MYEWIRKRWKGLAAAVVLTISFLAGFLAGRRENDDDRGTDRRSAEIGRRAGQELGRAGSILGAAREQLERDRELIAEDRDNSERLRAILKELRRREQQSGDVE